MHSGWPGPLGRTTWRHLPPTGRSAPERPSCCPGLGLQRRSTSDASLSSSPGRCRVPAHLGPAGREVGRGPAAAGGGLSWWPPAAGGPGREAQGRPGSRGSRVTTFIRLEDCTTAHIDEVKGGVQGQGEILINNPSPQALSRRGVTWTRVSPRLQLDPALGLQAWRRLLPPNLLWVPAEPLRWSSQDRSACSNPSRQRLRERRGGPRGTEPGSRPAGSPPQAFSSAALSTWCPGLHPPPSQKPGCCLSSNL